MTSAPRWLALPRVEDSLGDLYFGQQLETLPFEVARVYFVRGIPANAVRGGHAHRCNQEALFCLQGACTLWLYSPAGEERRFRLDDPGRGVYIPPAWWLELGEYRQETITLVCASLPYQESDYIRTAEAFFHERPFPGPVSRPRR
jgi:dTDP-4-dehydrorhamnose 3,5-epimerase-like enzyme